MTFESSHQQALAAIERGDTDEAVGLLLQAAAAGTLEGRVLNDLAVALLAQSGDGGRAEHLLNAALVVDPYYTDAMSNLAALRPVERGPGVLVSFCNSTRTHRPAGARDARLRAARHSRPSVERDCGRGRRRAPGVCRGAVSDVVV